MGRKAKIRKSRKALPKKTGVSLVNSISVKAEKVKAEKKQTEVFVPAELINPDVTSDYVYPLSILTKFARQEHYFCQQSFEQCLSRARRVFRFPLRNDKCPDTLNTTEKVVLAINLVTELRWMIANAVKPEDWSEFLSGKIQEGFALIQNVNRVEEIGKILNELGGFPAMSWACQQIPLSEQRDVDCIWDGMGDWRY